MTIDLINGLFELVGGLLQIINIVELYRDKKVTGVSKIPVTFFTIWGIFNIYFYNSLNLSLSLIGGLVITITNMIWLITCMYYYKQYKKNYNFVRPTDDIEKNKQIIKQRW